jgi:hypothetical protein
MPVRIARIALLLVVAALPVLTFGQIASSEITTSIIQSGPNSAALQPAKHLPYTAEFKTTTVQTLANGAPITRTFTETRAADSQGRTMNSHSGQNGGDQPALSFAHVEDPVENTQIT